MYLYIFYKLYLPIIFYSKYLFLFIIKNDPLTLAFSNLFLYFLLVLFLLEKKDPLTLVYPICFYSIYFYFYLQKTTLLHS